MKRLDTNEQKRAKNNPLSQNSSILGKQNNTNMYRSGMTYAGVFGDDDQNITPCKFIYITKHRRDVFKKMNLQKKWTPTTRRGGT